MPHADIAWDLPDPFILDISVSEADTDRLGHANNVVYVRW
ncbi:MAG: acyl-CoA thioesterase, partial [Marinobacter sp.]|nr:acyl-CoA thioesterase [Marinobacter sp.]